MFRLASDLRVYLHREPIDFRAGINSLAIVVEQSMGLDPFQRAVFAFCNRRRDRIKLLIYDRSGFWMLLKRLEADKIPLAPKSGGGADADDGGAALAA